MAGYVIGQINDIGDEDGFRVYQDGAFPTLAQYDGKVVINSAKIDPADGGWSPAMIVVVQCESVEQAQKWYQSPEYHAVIGQRSDSSKGSVIIVDGD